MTRSGRKGIAGAALLLTAGVSYSVFASFSSTQPPLLVEAGAAAVMQEPAFTTLQPVLLSQSSSIILLGTVLSHETANIFPRREGIVEDIYVDIGDKVTKNQVVALLLPKGVEGQSTAVIAEKNARKAQAQSDYVTTQNVAQETLINAQQKIQEKETALFIAKREQDSFLQQFAEQAANVRQMVDQGFTTVRQARQVTEQILIGSNSRPGDTVQEEDLLDQLGQLSRQTRHDVAPLFTALYDAEQAYPSVSDARKQEHIVEILHLANDALNGTITLLSATPSVPTMQTGFYTQQELANLTNKVLASQESILKMQEKIEDAVNMYEKLIAAEPELYKAYRSGKTEAAMSNKVRMMTSELRTIQNNYELTDASQQQMVERYRTMVDVANAQLQSEVAQSGHREIRSPFSGTVSKRFIEVGKIVASSMTAFELTDVPTSLAKKAKSEIQFGLPEHLAGALHIGETLVFFLPESEEKTYQAEVARISPQVDRQTHTVTVQAKVDDSLNLPHHTSVRVRIVDRATPLFRIPSFAVKREDDGNVLWVLNEESNLPYKARVSVRSEDGEFAEVTGNITAESRIILDSPGTIALPTEESPESTPTSL